jgi:hypothetical protein
MNFKLQGLPIIVTIIIILVTISIIQFGYVNHTTDRLYFSITQFELPNNNSITIGENSDVCYSGVPNNYMTVTYSDRDSAFSYKINNRDSCLYYKINGKNQNSHPISDDSDITIFNTTFKGDFISQKLKDFDNEYYMLKDILQDRIDSVILDSIRNNEIEFNSFIQKKEDKYNLIILDKFTTINKVGYRYTDTLPQGTEFKIQFFKMRNWSLKKNDDKYLHDDERSYFAKPVQLFTEWGAGHILVKRNKNNFSVTFPKAITTTIPIEKIQETDEKSETGVYLKQMLKSYPMPTDFYIPAFSNALSEYICEITPSTLFFQESNKRDTVALQTFGCFIPKINIETQPLELGSITYKSRILNACFYWSKHILLSMAWLILSLILFFSFPKSGTGIMSEKIKNARWYILGLFTLFWFFLNQKLLIAEKLTFTYPYFEKIYPVTYLTTLFSLFALFLLIIVVNKAYFKISGGIQAGDFIKWNIPLKLKILKKINGKKVVNYDSFLCRFIIVFGVLSACLIAFYGIKENFILPIWDSYTTEGVSGFWQIWRWQKIDVLNDNHFTVFMMVGLLLLILLALFIIHKKWQTFFNKVNLGKGIERIINEKCGWGWFIVLVFIGLCFFVLKGNFATALAVLILLYVLSFVMKILTDKIPSIDDRWCILENQKVKNSNKFEWSLIWFKYNLFKHKLWVWIISTFVLCCSFIGIGMSDLGFFINIFGIVTTWIILIFCCSKYNASAGELNEKILNVNFGAGMLIGLVLVSLAVVLFFNNKTNPENIDYERRTRRIQNCIMPKRVKKAGFLYSESDMQWMESMRYYAEKVKKGKSENYDIYGENNNFHPLISSGQSPVILNDVCVPGVYLGSLRRLGCFGLLFGVLALGILVYWFSIGDTWRRNPTNFEINRLLIGRLLAGNLWIGATLYLLLSYYWVVPFTGRLIPGFGVDAVGEALEIIVLFAFMCTLHNPCKSK